MIDIVERFMDQETQYKTARENCMVKLPVLLELQDDESIDLNSSFHEEGKTAINSVMVSGTAPILPEGKEANKTLGKPDEKKNYNLALGEKTSSEQGEQAQGELDPKTVKFAKGESKLESNEQYKQHQFLEKKGIVGNVAREIGYQERQFRKDFFNFELAQAKNSSLGTELLRFEFIQATVLFLLLKVS